jgi:hypothetical protein
LNLAELLRADEAGRPQKFSIYIADRDGANNPVEVGHWLDRAVRVMTKINGGCTRLPVAKGAWTHSKTGANIVDDTVVIYSYLFNPDKFVTDFHYIVELLHDYGHETNQDAVMAEFSGWSEEEQSYISEAYFIPSKNYLIKPKKSQKKK